MPAAVYRIGLLVLASLALWACIKSTDVPRIAAAADLRLALTDVARAFKRDTGQDVELVFGSSGNFHQQLRQGAPFDVFLSADEAYALDLAKTGITVDTGRLYAVGRLALVAPTGSPLKVDEGLAGLRRALASGQVRRFAIANPDHAPYGQRAREALEQAGLWASLQPRLIMGENVAQALQFAIEGGAEGGIVAWSLMLDPALAGRADYVLIPAEAHQPLRQRMVLMRTAREPARAFYDYLAQPAARAILLRHGFALPPGQG
ncbi:molybdate ABC transporter substrate-binding protein [Blastomonas sp.]|uniref:molybdate ABC transporter substrate-binding protein n=1 Tax=Blastomonas sp. TaxID=1909299 RepID=UPI002635A3AB|nr:molybdate ABC transporter substrate-binding protein [Blastomonas sp.]MDM7957107.1 molybdate ABC transporter substrate-binding protein [Blastomonas sp.]